MATFTEDQMVVLSPSAYIRVYYYYSIYLDLLKLYRKSARQISSDKLHVFL